MLIAVVMLTVFGFVRCDPQYAAEPETHFARKALWRGEADLVVAGDSRVYRGIAVGRMGRRMGLRARNFGFSGQSLCGPYLDAVESVLDGDAERRIVLLGVSPFSFRDSTSYRSGHERALDTIERDGETLIRTVRAERWREAMAPLELELVLDRMGWIDVEPARALTDEYQEVYHLDGWVASDRQVEDAERRWIEKLPTLAADRPHDEACFEMLLDRIRRWSEEGIVVAAFRLPTSGPTGQEEQRLWPTDWLRLRDVLRDSGGVWVDVPKSDWVLYDGSHLQAESAVRFTDALADGLVAGLADRDRRRTDAD